MYCPYCGNEVSPNHSYCPHCGTRIASATPLLETPHAASPPVHPADTPTLTPTTVKRTSLVIIAATMGILVIILSGALIVQAQQNANLQSEYDALRQQNDALQNQVSQLQSQLRSPTLTIWTLPQSLSSPGWFEAGVPDTFDYYVSFTSTVPISTYFLSFAQYVQYRNCGGSISCVSGTYYYYSATTSLSNGVFKLAEGCADYVAVYQLAQAGTIYPNVKVTYNPASGLTGACG